MGQLDNTVVVFTTDNGAEVFTYPDGGVTPFKGSKMNTWEGGMRAPAVIRWPGQIKPGTIYNDIFASLDWLPTLVEIGGGPKGNALNDQIQKGSYPGIVKTKLDGVNQLDYLTGKSAKSAREVFFYYAGPRPSAVRYKNWKMYFSIAPETSIGFAFPGVQNLFMAATTNLKRDPFEEAVTAGTWNKTQPNSFAGALAGPVTGYIYDWNMLPLGQLLWLKELESYKAFPPLQTPESWNLDQVTEQIRNGTGHPSQ
jgi:arylsulfatase